MELNGYGSKIISFELDGKKTSLFEIPETLSGKHTIRIVLESQVPAATSTNRQPVLFTLPAPILKYENQKITWQPIENAVAYKVLLNGRLLKTGKQPVLPVKAGAYAEYQVIAVDKNKQESFASEPVVVVRDQYVQTLPVENVAGKATLPYKGFTGDGFIEISTTVNKTVQLKVKVDTDGLYAIDFRYANGNGPTNTENKCAIRTLSVDGKQINAVVFPQRGKEEWSNWGFTNSLKVSLAKGEHLLSVSMEEFNENMNGEINQAMIDYVRISKIR
jgi:hypothetical protein